MGPSRQPETARTESDNPFLAIAAPGIVRGTAEALGGDALPGDDRVFFTIDAAATRRVGIACGAPATRAMLACALGGGKAKELDDIAAVLRGLTFAETLGERLGRIAETLVGLVDSVEAEAKQLFAEIDQWVVDAAALCRSRDPQLDLHGALPTMPAALRKAELATA